MTSDSREDILNDKGQWEKELEKTTDPEMRAEIEEHLARINKTLEEIT